MYTHNEFPSSPNNECPSSLKKRMYIYIKMGFPSSPNTECPSSLNKCMRIYRNTEFPKQLNTECPFHRTLQRSIAYQLVLNTPHGPIA